MTLWVLILLSCLGFFFVASLIFFGVALITASLGYQDEEGFHEGEEPSPWDPDQPDGRRPARSNRFFDEWN